MAEVQPYIEVIHQCFQSNGQLVTAQYTRLWSELQTPRQVSGLITVICVKFLGLITGEDRFQTLAESVRRVLAGDVGSTTLAPEVASDMQLRGSLVISLAYLLLFQDYDATYVPLFNCLRKWDVVRKELNKDPSKPLAPHLQFFDRMLKMVLFPNINEVDVINQAVDEIITSGTSFDFPTDTCDGGIIVASLLLPGLLRSPRGRLHAKLGPIVGRLLENVTPARQTEEKCLAVLSMLRQILFLPNASLLDLEAITAGTKNLLTWPHPVGTLAREVSLMIDQEMLTPGASFRAFLARDYPELVGGLTGGRDRDVHLLIDQQSTTAKSVFELLVLTQPHDPPVPELQLAVIANAMELVLRVSRDELGLEYVTKAELPTIYKLMLDAFQQVSFVANPQDSIMALQKSMLELRNRILTTSQQNQRRSVISFARPHDLVLPPLSLVFHVTRCSNANPDKDESGCPLLPSKMPNRPTFQPLLTLLNEYSTLGRQLKRKLTIRMAIVGTDASVTNTVASYAAVRVASPSLFEHADFAFYVVPVSDLQTPRTITAAVGEYDPLWGRHVYNFFGSILRIHPLLAPAPIAASLKVAGASVQPPQGPNTPGRAPSGSLGWQDALSASGRPVSAQTIPVITHRLAPGPAAASTDGTTPKPPTPPPWLPATLLRSELEFYVRAAPPNLPINVFQVECWLTSVDGPPTYIIPFLQRVELGQMAYAKSFIRQTNAVSGQSLQELQTNRNFRFVPPSLSLKSVSKNVIGVSRPDPPIDYRPYTRVVLANLPVPGETLLQVQAGNTWLEMLASEAESKKTKKPVDRLFHVSMAELEIEDKVKTKFDVLIDGELYGPCLKIRVSQVTVAEEPVVMRFCSYVPPTPK